MNSNINLKNVFFFGILLFVFMALFSRGLGEMFIGKTAAYAFQIIVSYSFFVFMMLKGHSIQRMRVKTLTLAITFLTVNIASYYLTIIEHGFIYGFVYFILMFTWFFYFITVDSNDYKLPVGPLFYSLLITGFLLFFAATYQQYINRDAFPGFSWYDGKIRPSSLTGSYLHYPIVIALLAIMLFEFSKFISRKYVVLCLVLAIAPLAAFSRSGFIIVLMGLIYIFYRYSSKVSYSKRIGLIVLCIFSLIVAIVLMPDDVWARVTSTFDTSSAGNDSRMIIWGKALSELNVENIIVGSNYGMYTNATSNITGETATVVESSFLQQLLSIGLFGTVLFYGLLFFVFKRINPDHIFLRAAIFSFAIQTLVYQSIEVFPAFTLVFIAPLISRALEIADDENKLS
ncbi:O-antigen ligase [Erwinia sp. Leaf53]|uniref:O-antigen ligase family protein n=1 Tax=Erwinia sp. Leaf53 TaxID=1736225 RepID=UPI0006F48DB6|nr:O-antigen ligase family protein [Erwinia sp. Leaf53]KQN63730.1 hypothetical protein ASF13_19340 [Erwinia sp. Leaf53]